MAYDEHRSSHVCRHGHFLTLLVNMAEFGQRTLQTNFTRHRMKFKKARHGFEQAQQSKKQAFLHTVKPATIAS